MFGYVVANQAILSDEQIDRYRAVYCGLCRAIGRRHGQAARLSLTYDMTFLVLLLDSLEEPDLATGKKGCVAHPVGKQNWRQSKWTDYGADMNVALAYYNCLDDWDDDRNVVKYACATALRPACRNIRERWPEQCRRMADSLERLGALERERSASLDDTSQCFGQLMAGLFAPQGGYWQPTLERLGDWLGRFIYVMDAVLDEEADRKKGRYNPVTAFREANGGFEPLPVLEMLIGESTLAFEALPLEQDLDLLRNILYSGVWTQWVNTQKKAQKRQEGTTEP
ncbi:MAG: DUF5685 family protein [Clostridiales bacterium]|nr:DUF5685 family protein [Clostridiales bacterium]